MSKRKLYDLINQRAGMLAEAETALDARQMEAYAAKMAEATALNAEIEALQALDAERGRFDATDPGMLALHNVQQQAKQGQQTQNALDAARSGNDYANAFAKALKSGVSVQTGAGMESYQALYNALTVGGGNPAGADGGFLVPVDFDNMIHRRLKDMLRLADLFNTETVNAPTGWRAVEKGKAGKPLPLLDEAVVMTPTDQPAFEKVSFSLKKYGDFIIASSELLNDNTAGLMQYLAEWFAPKVALTENSLLLKLLNGLNSAKLTPGAEVRDLKRALNKDLNTAYSRGAHLLCNQDSYSFLDELTDQNGRGLLVPDPTAADVTRFKGRPVTFADSDLLPSHTVTASGATKGDYYPVYIGDFKSLGTLFRRSALEFASTNVGGTAWNRDTTEVRGIIRLDAQKMRGEAAIKREIFIGATPTA